MPDIAIYDNSFFSINDQSIIEIPDAIISSAWYRADSCVKDGSDKVSELTDISGNGNHLYQTVQSQKPTYLASHAAFNNKPVISFSAAALTFLTRAGILNTNNLNFYAFSVHRSTINTAHGIWGCSVFGGIPRYSLTRSLVSSGSIELIWDSSSVFYATAPLSFNRIECISILSQFKPTVGKNILRNKKNQIAISSSNRSINDTSANFTMGAYNNASGVPAIASLYMTGEIAELIIFLTDKVLPSTYINSIETYLMNKYAIS